MGVLSRYRDMLQFLFLNRQLPVPYPARLAEKCEIFITIDGLVAATKIFALNLSIKQAEHGVIPFIFGKEHF